MHRRDLLRFSLLSPLLYGCAAMPLGAKTASRTWGIQGGTVFAPLEKDFEGTLRAIAAMGYREIGTTGSFGRDPAYVRSVLDECGLVSPNNHVAPMHVAKSFAGWVRKEISQAQNRATYLDAFSMANVRATFEDAIKTCHILGQKYAIWPIMLPEHLASRQIVEQHIALFNELGESCAREGVTFVLHNHDREFARLGDDVIFDLILANTDPARVKFEIDFYWAAKAGADSLAYLRKYPGRFELCHLKDMTASGDFAAVGNGTLDMPGLIRASDDVGMKHYLVEIDRADDPLASIRSSIDYLRKKVG